jgi:RNA polymerase sigma-70 factor, ECF subfamily
MTDPDELYARFDDIVRETQSAIRGHIAGMGVPWHHVDDVAQEVFLDYFRQLSTDPPAVEPLRWLRGMARNASLQYFRRQSRQAHHLAAIADLISPPAEHDEARNDDADRIRHLTGCLERLEGRQRELLQRYYGEECDAQGLASEEKRSVGAIHMQLARLREILRRCILQQAGAPA